MGDGLVSTSAQESQEGGGSGLSGLHGQSLVLLVGFTAVLEVVDAGGATVSVVVIVGGGAAGTCVVVVVVVVVDEDGTDELDPLDDDAGLEVLDGATVTQVDPGFVGSPDCFPDSSRSTPSSTPANADAATAEPHAAQRTRTASSFAGITRTSRGGDSSETVQGVRLGINALAELDRDLIEPFQVDRSPPELGDPIDSRARRFPRRRADREEWFDGHPVRSTFRSNRHTPVNFSFTSGVIDGQP